MHEVCNRAKVVLQCRGWRIAFYVCDPLYCRAVRTSSGGHPVDSVFVSIQGARPGGDDRKAGLRWLANETPDW
jgi:hypothetical protein